MYSSLTELVISQHWRKCQWA